MIMQSLELCHSKQVCCYVRRMSLLLRVRRKIIKTHSNRSSLQYSAHLFTTMNNDNHGWWKHDQHLNRHRRPNHSRHSPRHSRHSPRHGKRSHTKRNRSHDSRVERSRSRSPCHGKRCGMLRPTMESLRPTLSS